MGWPADITVYKLLTDWGSLLGGLMALAAGGLAYWGARQAADRQVHAMAQKDRLQGRGIVVAISPELLKLEVDLERIDQVLAAWLAWQIGKGVDMEKLILDAKIEVPPMIERSIDNFYLIENGGYDVMQLVSVILQYNGLVEKLGRGANKRTVLFDFAEGKKNLDGHLKVIRMVLAEASDKIAAVHVEAVKPPPQSAS